MGASSRESITNNEWRRPAVQSRGTFLLPHCRVEDRERLDSTAVGAWLPVRVVGGDGPAVTASADGGWPTMSAEAAVWTRSHPWRRIHTGPENATDAYLREVPMILGATSVRYPAAHREDGLPAGPLDDEPREPLKVSCVYGPPNNNPEAVMHESMASSRTMSERASSGGRPRRSAPMKMLVSIRMAIRETRP